MKASNKDKLLKEWNNRYEPLKNAFYVPNAHDGSYVPKSRPENNAVTVQRMIVDMEQLSKDLHENCPDWSKLHVYADVIIFPAHSDDFIEFAFELGGSETKTTLFARSIVIADDHAMFINRHEASKLTIYTSEIVGGSLRYFNQSHDPASSSVLSLKENHVGFTISANDNVVQPIKSAPTEMVRHDVPTYWTLMSSFNTASALMIQNPTLASELLEWTSIMAKIGEELDLQHLALSAANMQGFIMQQKSDVPFVPTAQEEAYAAVIERYKSAAKGCEDAFNRSVDKLETTSTLDEFVKSNGEYFTDQEDGWKQESTRMEKLVEDANKVLTQNLTKMEGLTAKGGKIDGARYVFQAGIEKFKKDQEQKAILAIFGAVFELGSAMALMAVGDEAAVGGAVDGATKIAKTAKTTSEMIKTFEKLAETIKKIAAVVIKLKELMEKLSAVLEAIKQLKDADDLKASDFSEKIQIDSGEEVFDNAYWDDFELRMKDLLASPIGMGIDGAANYLQQLMTLSIYGKATYANQSNLVQLQQKLFHLILQGEIAKKQKDRLNHISQDAGELRDRLQSAKIMAYQNLLRIKSRLLFFTDQQVSAFRYWGVMPELPQDLLPSLQDSISQLDEKLGKIEDKKLQFMSSFSAVQPMHQTILIDDIELIENMKSTSQLVYNIDFDHDKLIKFGRIRINCVRARVNEEAVSDRSEDVMIDVISSSHYLDRYKKNDPILEYVSGEFKRRFDYNLEKNLIISDGTIPQDYKKYYFEPTPFTTWTFKLFSGDFDLSKLTSIKFEIIGEWCALDLN